MTSATWSKIRRTFRWCRISFLFLVLLVAATFVWLNTMGLPSFVQERMMEALARQNLRVDAGNIRLEGYHRVLLEDVRLRTTATNAPELRIRSAEIKLNRRAMRHLSVEVDGLIIRNGSLAIPLSSQGQIRPPLVLTNLSAELTFHEDDRWELSTFQSMWRGMKFEASLILSNVSALGDMSLAQTGGGGAVVGNWQSSVQEVIEAMEQVEFEQPPKVRIQIFADAKNQAAQRASMRVAGADMHSTWGTLGRTLVIFHFEPTIPATSYVGSVTLRSDHLHTQWAEADYLEATVSAHYPILTNIASFHTDWDIKAKEIRSRGIQARRPAGSVHIIQTSPNEASFQSTFDIRAASVVTPWINSENPFLELGLTHSYPLARLTSFLASSLPSTNAPKVAVKGFHLPNPLEFWLLSETWKGTWKGRLGRSVADFGSFDSLQLGGEMQPSTEARPVAERGSMMQWLGEMDILSSGRLVHFNKGNLNLPEMLVRFHWKAPWLDVDRLEARLEHGLWTNQVRFNPDSRKLEGSGKLVAPPIWLAGLLTTNLPPWVSHVQLADDPVVSLRLSVTLPPNDAAPEVWREVIRSNLVLEAETTLTNLALDEVKFPQVELKAGLSAGVVHLRRLGVLTTEGRLDASGWIDPARESFQAEVESRFNPRILRPIFPSLDGLFEFVKLEDPPHLNLNAHGVYSDLDSVEGHGTVKLGALTLRGEGFSDVDTVFGVTNRLVYFTNVLAHYVPPGGSTQMLKSPFLLLDLPNMSLWITNGYSTYDPYAFTRIIGPRTAAAITPYQFFKTPTVYLHGRAPLDEKVKADLYFDVTGGPFRYWRFNADQVKGLMHWEGDHLTVTNLVADMYGGRLDWSGDFDFLPGGEADYSFKSEVGNINLGLALGDVLQGTNQIEGVLNGVYYLKSANSRSIETWKGEGVVDMRDGYLWSIPVFGAFSGFLDSISPGVGKSRLKSGTASFSIDQATVSTRDMELRAPAFRLKYNGKVHFDSSLDARAEMEFFRDAWLVGRLFSTALWPLSKVFETKVTGTLQAPVTEAMHIPKIIMAPFHPFQTLRDLFPKAFNEGPTNSVPEGIQQ